MQRRFTRIAFSKVFPSKEIPDYSTRLEIFGLKSLRYRRIEFDLHLCYKIVKGFSDIPFESIFSYCRFKDRSRFHNLQLQRKATAKSSILGSFSFRVIRIWNKLPTAIVEATNLTAFKSKLSKFDLTNLIGNNPGNF